MLFTIVAFTILLVYGAFQKGAVLVSDGMIIAAGVALLAFAYYGFAARAVSPPATKYLLGLMFWLVAAVSFQLIPLPPSLLSSLSPYSAQIMVALDPTGWFPIALSPAHSKIWLIRLTTSLLAMFMARDIAWRSKWTWSLITPILVVAGGEAVLGLVQCYASVPGVIAQGTYVNRDHFSGLMERGIPLAVMAGVGTYQSGRKRYETSGLSALRACGFFALAASMLVAVLFTLSRMGFLTTLASLLFIGAVSSSIALSNRLSASLRWLPALIAGVVIALAFIYLPTDALMDRFAQMSKQDLSADTRSQIWKDSLQFAAHVPWFGCGLGGYSSAILAFQHVAPMYSIVFAHNDYIQASVEFGLFGFVPLALLIGLAVKGSLDRAFVSREESQRYLGIGCAGSLFAMLFHGLADFNLYIFANNLSFFWIAGVALGIGAFRFELPSKWRKSRTKGLTKA